MSPIYSFNPVWKKGSYDFSKLRGKVILIVNTASQCGFTGQYAGLEALHQKYKDRGLQVLGFPCNQFGSQEPGSNAEIGSFCQVNYGVSFPIMDKVHVNGDQTHPLYDYLKSQAYVSLPGDFDSLFRPGVLGLTRIKWNFEKFLIDKDGTVYQRYSSLTKPESLEHDIEQLLAHEPRL